MAQTFSEQQLGQLWTKAGGDPKVAPLMAKLAIRESGGNPYATNHNTNGSIDRGLWQVNSIWGPYSTQSLGNPLAAAKAAVHVYKTQGPKAWSTYNAATDQKYLGGFKNPSASSPSTGYTSPSAPPSTDNRRALALSLLGEGGGSDPLTSLLGNVSSSYGVDPLQLAITAALQRSASTGSSTPRGTPAFAGTANTAQSGNKLDLHTTYVDGKPVVGWIANILKQAKAAGWKGTVTSGERTKSQQLAAAQHFGLQHYPNGPLASNHVVGHDGAVDVSDPNGLKATLQKLGITQLKSAMANDPVHFSKTGF